MNDATHSDRTRETGQLEPDYPTDEQIEECWEAHKSGGERGILEFLKEHRRRREAEQQGPAKS
jgi:hypothetical protein